MAGTTSAVPMSLKPTGASAVLPMLSRGHLQASSGAPSTWEGREGGSPTQVIAEKEAAGGGNEADAPHTEPVGASLGRRALQTHASRVGGRLDSGHSLPEMPHQ